MFKDNTKYGGYQSHPLYKELYKLLQKNVTTLNYSVEHPGCTEFGLPPQGFAPAIYTKVEQKPTDAATPEVAPKAEPQLDSEKPGASLENSKGDFSAPQLGLEAQQPVVKSPSMVKAEEESLLRKKQKKCDEIFAEYLDHVAKQVNKDCYKQVLKFVFLFRECLNHYGERLNKSKQDQGLLPVPNGKGEEDKQGEYCLNNNAEQAPEISNEFVTLYLDEIKTGFEKMDSIELTQNFCGWLFSNGYTCSKLSLIQENPQ